MGLELRVQLYVAGESKNFLVDTGAASTVLTSYSSCLLLQNLYHFGCDRNSNYKKIHPSTSLFWGWTDIFPPVSGGPLVSVVVREPSHL